MRWLFMVLVAVAYVFALHAPPKHRRAATSVMTAIAGAWALYLLAWSPWPPASLLWSIGLPLESEHLWSITDALLGAFVLVSGWRLDWSFRRFWWGWSIFSLLAIQQCFHTVRDFGLIEWGVYDRALDLTFLAQLACIYALGGPGVWLRITHLYGVCRDLLRAPGAAFGKTRP